MKCIFCGEENEAVSREHVVSEAFGNRDYIMEKGAVCDECNRRFSAFEGRAVSQTVFVMERARMGIPTKKGNVASGSVAELKISGDKAFSPNKITLQGLSEENVSDVNPVDGTFKVFVKAFDGTEVPTSKLLLKMGLESLYTSKPKIFNKHDFSELNAFVLGKSTVDWPFITTDAELTSFSSVPSFNEKYRLGLIRCTLRTSEVSDSVLLFKFKYGGIAMVINLLNKGVLWMKDYLDAEPTAMIYPEHFRAKLEKRLTKRAAVQDGGKHNAMDDRAAGVDTSSPEIESGKGESTCAE